MNRLEKTMIRLLSVEMLRSARRFYKLSYLSSLIGVDASMLSRYATGQMVPSLEQAERIIEFMRGGIDLPGLILQEAEGPNGVIDPSLPLMDKSLLRLVAIEFYMRLRGRRISKILVPETSGVVLATALSTYLNSDVVVARRRKTGLHIKWIEAHVSAPPNINRSFYIPYHSIGKRDRVIIVDDFVRSGYTLSSMVKLVENTGASLEGVLSLIVFGERWRRVTGIDKLEYIASIEEGKTRIPR